MTVWHRGVYAWRVIWHWNGHKVDENALTKPLSYVFKEQWSGQNGWRAVVEGRRRADVGVGVKVVTSLRSDNMSLASYKTYTKWMYILKYGSKDVFKVHFPFQNGHEKCISHAYNFWNIQHTAKYFGILSQLKNGAIDLFMMYSSMFHSFMLMCYYFQ